ncbi:repeat domain (List_Bact_rpt) [Clostridium cavendishii DSM 21758]|uniref:Repeat domain (List_Bact_rpt) n=1 Tax=Clostridium cavendishii DSM 21758 TaxID=1121302 RepID=A0A1M6GUQ0_9CLOT|nr:InlB B-repeat-containing protein [Clostridium cavendishii]SHJ13698.1 repeat domain (List_Bact_rpt) [Clostridium cavendishii DSM 21758]
MKKNVFKKIMAFLLTFNMCIGIIPGFNLEASKVYAVADPNDSRTKFDKTFFGKSDYDHNSTKAPGDDYIVSPHGLAKDSLGNLYTVEQWDSSSRVHKISPTGTHIAVWGSKGTNNGQFISPSGIAVDDSDNIYVTELNGHRIQKFKSDGTFLASFNSWGSFPNQLSSPNSVAVDSSGAVYIANTGGKSVVKLTSDLNYNKSWQCGDNPATIFVDKSDNKIYVGEQYLKKVYMYDTNGVAQGSIDTVDGVTAIYVDSSKNIYIGCRDNKIYKYGPDLSLKYSWSPMQGIPYGFYMDSNGDMYVTMGDKIVKSRLASINNNLSSLTIDGQALNPVFNKATTDYTVNVSEDTKSINLTPTVEDSTATIKINDIPHTSGTAKAFTVGLGDNPIKITVTSENGEEKFYNVIVRTTIPPDRRIVKLSDGGFYLDGPQNNELYVGDGAESSLKFNLNVIPYEILDASLNIKTNMSWSAITPGVAFNYNLYGSRDNSWTVGYTKPINRDFPIFGNYFDDRTSDYWKSFDVKDFVRMQSYTPDRLCSFVMSSSLVGQYMCIYGMSNDVSDRPYLYIRIPAIDKTTINFDKNVANAIDIPTQIIVDDVLSNIKNGDISLKENTDYIVSGNTITFKKEYLKTLPTGQTNFTVNLSKCTPQTISVNINDTTPAALNSTISPNTASFDKKLSAQEDVETVMTLNGNDLSDIQNGQTKLISGIDYELSGNKVIIKKEYLAKQEVGTTNLTFNFSAGVSQNLAIKVEKHCIVTFKDFDGRIISTQENIEYEKSATAPTNPVREGYTFTGWDKAFDSVKEDLVINAQYEINHYKVIFKDYDGRQLGTEQSIDYGKGAVAPTSIAREGYTFVGWDRNFSNVSEDLVVTAKYEINHYKVTFKDFDGKTISTQENIEYGKEAVAPTNPIREGYTFVGWDKDFKDIKENLEVTAKYDINHYKVTFKDDAGNIIDTPQTVDYKKAAVAPTVPIKINYSFIGWDKEFNEVKEDLEVKAMYAINKYTVTFKDFDGNVIGKEQTVEYGKNVTAPTAPTKEGYTFIGWDKELNVITENLEVKAKYEINHYKVIFKDYDGRQIGKEQTVDYGKSAAAITAPIKEGYSFIMWDKAFNVVKEDLIVNAIYGINYYTVKFKDDKGNLIGEEQRVEYGKSVVVPEAPKREGYTFIGWDKDSSNVTEDLVINAKYQINHYKVTFKDFDGRIISDQDNIEYGKPAVAPENPKRIGYKFSAWDKKFDNITSDLVVTAKYDTGYTYDIPVATEAKGKKETKCDIGYFTSGKNTIVIKNEIANLVVPTNIITPQDMQGVDSVKILQSNIDEKTKKVLLQKLPNDIGNILRVLELNVKLFDNKDNFIKDIHTFANNQKVKIGIKLTSEELKNLDTGKLSMYYYDEEKREWVELGGSFDKNSMEFVYYTPHFTKFAIMEKQTVASSDNKDKINNLLQTGSRIDTNVLLGTGLILILAGLFVVRKRKS